MKIILNEELVDIKIEEEKTLHDFLFNFEKICEENQATLVGINVDGKDLSVEEIDNADKIDLTTIDTLSLNTVSLIDIKNAFNKILNATNELIPKFENIPIDIQTKKDGEVSNTLTSFTYYFDFFCRIICLCSLFPDFFNNFFIDEKNPQEFLGEFSPILHDFEEAMKNNDTVMISDLSEYEILPRLEIIGKTFADALDNLFN